jgi:sugar fermentation stimulation protein A
MTVARDIDPVYAAAFDAAQKAGVEVIAFDTLISPHEITIGRALTTVT